LAARDGQTEPERLQEAARSAHRRQPVRERHSVQRCSVAVRYAAVVAYLRPQAAVGAAQFESAERRQAVV